MTLGTHTDDPRTVVILRASGPVFRHGVLKQVGQSTMTSELGVVKYIHTEHMHYIKWGHTLQGLRVGGVITEFGADMCAPPRLKQTGNKALLHSTENSTQHSATTYAGKEPEKSGSMYASNGLPLRTPETNTTLSINCTTIQNKKLKNKEKKNDSMVSNREVQVHS